MVQLAQGLAEVGLLVASIKGWCCLLLALSCIELFPNGSSAMCPLCILMAGQFISSLQAI